MAIYTKTGDKGETRVFNRKTGKLTPVGKDSCHIKTIGAIDELNSYLGIVKSSINESIHRNQITEIQGNLFTINSILAGSKLRFSKIKTKKLEKQIDEWEGKLPVQTNFIYYGGSTESSLLFYARALVRRAERELVEFSKEQMVPEAIRTYFNRLSDYLFMMARMVNFEKKFKESFWKTKTSS